MKILLKDFTAITLGEPPVREGVSITIEDGVITHIAEPPDQLPYSEHDFDEVLSGRGKLAMPGLINAHTHLAMVLMRGYADDLPLMRWLQDEIWPLEAKLTPDDIYWGSLLALAEGLRSGTTCFADMYFAMDRVAQTVEESGLRALLSYGIIAPEPGEKLDRELRIAEEFIAGFHSSAEGRIRAAISPHAPYTCHPRVWERAVEIAREHDIIIHTHVSETRKEVEDAQRQWGKTPVAYLESLGVYEVPVLAAHCVHLTDGDLEILLQYDIHPVHNPTSNLKLASGVAPVQKLLEVGVNVALGTDGTASNNDLNMIEEIRLAALLQKGILAEATAIPALEALKLGTVRGACALGWEEIGSIEVGKRADLVVLGIDRPHWVPNYDPISNLVYSAQAADVETVIVDGRIVMKNREILTFDEERAKAHVKRFQDQHSRRR
jgi:5-methylthioadenosine/S-adenosylhomocysteine deaminase